MSIVFLDPDVKHVGAFKLRELNADKLRAMGDEVFVLQDGDEPLAVLFSWERYQSIREEWLALHEG